MRIAILGATGKIGRLAVNAALEKGHETTALVRSKSKMIDALGREDLNLRIIEGSITDKEIVRASLAGQDAVIWTIGAPLTWRHLITSPTICGNGTQMVLNNIDKTSYVVFLTSIGVGDGKNVGRPIFRWLIRPILLGRILKDRENQESFIHQSDVFWSIVRPAELRDAPPTKPVREISEPPFDKVTFISRQAVADYLIREAVEMTHLRQSIVLTE